nr:MAG TPA: hypothetical protein [Caudoviricetes sp.]
MVDKTYVYGLSTNHEWLVHITTVDETTKQRYDYYAFFDDRAKADTYVKGLVCMMPEKNVIIRMTKVECVDNVEALRIY